MNIGRMNGRPTVYEELSFLQNIYTTDAELHAKLHATGFKKYRDIEVPNVDCFMYVPFSFPTTIQEMDRFDFAARRGRAMILGVCIGGTTLLNGWGEKLKLGIEGITKTAHNNDKADRTSSQILQGLKNFSLEYPQLARYDIRLNVCICGYSLGGLFAQVTTIMLQNWVDRTGNSLTCRTFDGPGVPELYHDIAENYGPRRGEYWRQIISNYKSFPSPLNTVFKDIGRIFHLKSEAQFQSDWRWRLQCLATTSQHIIGLMMVTRPHHTSLDDSTSPSTGERQGDGEKKRQRRNESEVMENITWCIAGATRLGMGINEIVRSHDIATMMDCFDGETGALLPDCCVEMKQWPNYESFRMTLRTAVRAGAEAMLNHGPTRAEYNLVDPDQPGLSNLLLYGGKRGYLEGMLANLSGYCPL